MPPRDRLQPAGQPRSRQPASRRASACQVASAGPALTSFAVADERQAQQPLVGEEPLDDLGVVHPEVGRGPRRGRPRASGRASAAAPEPLDEPAQLARGDRLAPQVDEVDRDPALLEEAQGRPGRPVVLAAEDLDRAAVRTADPLGIGGRVAGLGPRSEAGPPVQPVAGRTATIRAEEVRR